MFAMKNIILSFVLGTVAAVSAVEPGFTSLFDGKTLKGWKLNGGSAEFWVENGTIAGKGVVGTPGNTFLCTEREYENFIFRAEFKCESGNSGVQFRSSTIPEPSYRHGTKVRGYQSEITVDGTNTGRVYDEARRGYRHGIIWLDDTPQERLDAAKRHFHVKGWNEVEIQCVGPSIKTWINGRLVGDVLDDVQFRGFFGLQIHAQKKIEDGEVQVPGRAWWRNLRIRTLPNCSPWRRFFVKGADGQMKVEGAKYVIPQDWQFVTEGGETYLRGIHDEKEKKDGLVISHDDYANFIARVTYKLNGGNSALYFRAAEEDIPWVLKGFQNEIAGNERDSALWHTQGKTTKGRGWVATNDELVGKVRDAKGGWNTTATIAVGNRIVDRLNGFQTFDIVDEKCEKTGKLGLQLHGGCKNEVRFKDWEMMPIDDWMLPYINASRPAYHGRRSAAEFEVRKGIGNVIEKIKAGKEIKIAYLGGSITEMDGWRRLSREWLAKEYPNAKFTEIHAAIGGTGSDLGVFRFEHDALNLDPDLLFVEFATNDSGASPESIWENFDGIVRKTWRRNPKIDIVFTYTITSSMMGNYRDGFFNQAASAMEYLADHYGIPSIGFGPRVAGEVAAGRLVMSMGEVATAVPKETPDRDRLINEELKRQGRILFAKDGVHPALPGHGFYLESIKAAWAAMKELPAVDHSDRLGTPFYCARLENAKMVQIERRHLVGDSWKMLDQTDNLQRCFSRRGGQFWMATKPGDGIEFKFKGSECRIYDLLGPDCGQVWLTVDGKRYENMRVRFDSYCTYYRLAGFRCFKGDDGIHTVKVEIDAKQPDRTLIHQRSPKEDVTKPKYDGTKLIVCQFELVGDLVD